MNVAGVHYGNWVLDPFEFSPLFLSDAVPINGFNLRVSKLRQKKMNVLTKKHKQTYRIMNQSWKANSKIQQIKA